MSTVVLIALLLGACYGALLLVAFAFQSRLVYFPNVPSRAVGPGPDSIGLAYRRVDILTEDGVSLVAWYLPVSEPRGTVLFFHGNAGNISHRLESLRVFNELGLATLIFDYRGYGESEGEISENGIYRDAEAASYRGDGNSAQPDRRVRPIVRSCRRGVCRRPARAWGVDPGKRFFFGSRLGHRDLSLASGEMACAHPFPGRQVSPVCDLPRACHSQPR